MQIPTPTLAPLRCLLIDDEPLAHTVLRSYLARLPGLVSWAGSCYDGAEALQHLLVVPVDVLFLDVDMPGLTGLELLRALPEAPAVVLTTAHATYALDAYELAVADYLLKPIRFERFAKTIGRLRAAALASTAPQPPTMTPISSASLSESLFLKTDSGAERVRLTQLLFVEGYGNFVKCHLLSGRIILTADTLKHLETQLPTVEFVRVHKSYLVNVSHIEGIQGNCLRVGNRELPIGSTYRQGVLRRLTGA
ncbi:LytR/AlgR family response regulator transcription factor [Hymenobacter arizonensis]|uniref:DNA-binding response regulator, LytR/AlgR family n=1 Tax=Hymenobacter arizonensis TaxID=1227077 RepID=A0A1I6BFB7_HYMAR|nr:LytTR family DNA-binding domain-containing protein [Hymenobacter arizonensis]SFQ79665.1 DNA-binding response regulator, LytR/AlgR family [Hymenobacter arizonensis]